MNEILDRNKIEKMGDPTHRRLFRSPDNALAVSTHQHHRFHLTYLERPWATQQISNDRTTMEQQYTSGLVGGFFFVCQACPKSLSPTGAWLGVVCFSNRLLALEGSVAIRVQEALIYYFLFGWVGLALGALPLR